MAHEAIERAGFLVTTQMVKRKIMRGYNEEAMKKLKEANERLLRLIAYEATHG
jgi:hypothetical protein